MRSIIRQIAYTVAVLVAATIAALANTWSGDWGTNFGQLRLLQNNDRLYGARGVFVDGRALGHGRVAWRQ